MKSNRIAGIARIVAFMTLISTSLFAGVVGGPRKEAGTVSANRYQEFTYEFEHYQDANIKVVFEITGQTSAACDKLKVKLLVDGQWFMTGASRIDTAGVIGSEECVFEGGYGKGHKFARDRRNVTIQVINERSENTVFILTTN